MRRIVVSAFTLFLISAPSLADSVNVTCRQFARAMADEYMAGRLERAEKNAPLGNADQVLIIGAGRAHYMPRTQTGITRSYLQERNLWTAIYNEEYWRCIWGGDININVDGSQLGN